MPYRALQRRNIRWRPLQGEGIEHFSVEPTADGLQACGVVIGERGGQPYGVWYRFTCDFNWAVRTLDIETTDGKALSLDGDGHGSWRTRSGEKRTEFDGCIDIDLAGTPVTNTLPIRRERWQAGQTHRFTMLYVPFDSLSPRRDEQTYTCLEEARRFRYQATERSFEAELLIDEDGFVLDYPTLFRRVDQTVTIA